MGFKVLTAMGLRCRPIPLLSSFLEVVKTLIYEIKFFKALRTTKS